ncbi:HNH endonuclease [Sulfurimonas sp. NW7]|uniref:HNH endonuclease n=1 Tax=Sulfurimonas sp. NW7 TaxID=2922727 RepID=UPI003DA969AA
MTNKHYCALCNALITKKNNSKEHIIPNAIGGKKKILNFICKECNNKSGNEWDSDLTEQLSSLCTYFGIKRDRGNVQPHIVTTTAGDKFQLNANASMKIHEPAYNETKIDDGVEISISARTMKEARNMLKGVKGKYPNLDIEELMDNAKVNTSYCNDMIQLKLSIGGLQAGRSIVKSVLALAVKSGVNPKSCEHAIEYLIEEKGNPCFGYYYDKDPLLNRPEGVPLHCVHVKGDKQTKQLLGYIEFFGAFRIVTCLSSEYNGDEFSNCYAINPIKGEILDIKINLELTSSDIKAIYNYERYSFKAVEDAFSKVISFHQKSSAKKEQDRVVHEAVAYAFEHCGAKEGEQLTEAHRQKIIELTMKKMQQYLIHIAKNIRI